MEYALHIAADGRILSATFACYGAKDAVRVDVLPEGDLSDYRYAEQRFIYDPVEKSADPVPTQLDRIEAQLIYTAMMTDTLLEV